jgi:hypothetical protein
MYICCYKNAFERKKACKKNFLLPRVRLKPGLWLLNVGLGVFLIFLQIVRVIKSFNFNFILMLDV